MIKKQILLTFLIVSLSAFHLQVKEDQEFQEKVKKILDSHLV